MFLGVFLEEPKRNLPTLNHFPHFGAPPPFPKVTVLLPETIEELPHEGITPQPRLTRAMRIRGVAPGRFWFRGAVAILTCPVRTWQ